MSDFAVKLFNLTTYIFDKTDNVIVFIPLFAFYFAFCFALISWFIRRF